MYGDNNNEHFAKDLNKYNILEKVKENIYIEDKFIRKHFIATDFDFFIRNEIGIFLLEVKSKYRSNDGKFGINKFQYERIKEMCSDYSIKPVNIILDSEEFKEKTTSHKQSQYRTNYKNLHNSANKKWIYSLIPMNLEDTRIAPSRTSYTNNKHKKQQFYYVDAIKYKKLDVKFNFINLNCECGGYYKKKNGPYGDFLGCSNFVDKNIKCKKTKKIDSI